MPVTPRLPAVGPRYGQGLCGYRARRLPLSESARDRPGCQPDERQRGSAGRLASRFRVGGRKARDRERDSDGRVSDFESLGPRTLKIMVSSPSQGPDIYAKIKIFKFTSQAEFKSLAGRRGKPNIIMIAMVCHWQLELYNCISLPLRLATRII